MIFGILLGVLFFGVLVGGIILTSVGGYNEKKGMLGGGIVSIVIGFALFLTIPFSFHQVNTGEVATVKEMGQIKYVREAGTHFDFWMTRQYTRYDTKIKSLSVETQAYSQDAQTMTVQMSVHYQIDASKAVEIGTKYGSLEVLENRITGKAIQETKDVLTQRGAEKIISERNLISQEIATAVENAIGSEYYVDIQTVALTNIDFSDAFEKAVEEKMVAAQKKLQAEIENEMKIAAAKAEADAKLEEAKQKVEIAKQEAEAAKIKANNEAEIKEIEANAEAEAREIVAAAWNSMSEEAREATLRQLALEKWDGKLPETMVGNDFLTELLGALQQQQGTGI